MVTVEYVVIPFLGEEPDLDLEESEIPSLEDAQYLASFLVRRYDNVQILESRKDEEDEFLSLSLVDIRKAW